MEHPMKQRTNGRAVQGAARESNGARKGLRVGKAAGCMYTADGESERYEYDKARYIVFRIHRESAARVATRVEGPEGAVFVFVPGRNAYSGETRGSLHQRGESRRCAAGPGRRRPGRFRAGARLPLSLPSPIRQPLRSYPARTEYGKWINATANTSDIADTIHVDVMCRANSNPHMCSCMAPSIRPMATKQAIR